MDARGGGGLRKSNPARPSARLAWARAGRSARTTKPFLSQARWTGSHGSPDRAPLGVNYTNDEKSVSSQGLDVDATWNATETLVLTFAGRFRDPVCHSFTASAAGDISATTPSGIPETATPTLATCSFDVKNVAAFVRADWQYESPVGNCDAVGAGFTGTDNNALLGHEKEISTIKASAGFTTENGLGVTFRGRNISDDQYITTPFPGAAQAGTLSGYPSAPPTYGVTIRKSF